MTFATYGPRTNVHPTRHGGKKTTTTLWIVLHTSEGGEADWSAEALSAFMTTPATATNLASYNDVFDHERVLPAVPHNVIPYAAGGGNALGIHGCFPGLARQTRAEWLDANSLAQIKTAARWIIDVAIEFDIPLIRISWEQVKAGQSGICDHYDISRAFKKSDHTDVGPGFPWDVLFAEIVRLVDNKPLPPLPPGPPLEVGEMHLVNPARRLYDTRNQGTKKATTLVACPTGLDPGVVKAVRVNITIVPQGIAGWCQPDGATSYCQFTASTNTDHEKAFPLNPDGSISLGATTPVHWIIDLVEEYH